MATMFTSFTNNSDAFSNWNNFLFVIVVFVLLVISHETRASAPILSELVVEPLTLEKGHGHKKVRVSVKVSDQDGDLKSQSVTAKLFQDGKKNQKQLKDNGKGADAQKNDRIFSSYLKVKTKKAKEIKLQATAKDKDGNKADLIETTLTVIDSQLPPILSDLTIDPAMLALSTKPQLVTLSVQVTDPDGDIKKNGVKVKSLNGKKKHGIQGVLKDNGKHGDEVAGDGRYTAQIKIHPHKIGSIDFIITAKDKAGHKAEPLEASLLIVEQLPELIFSSNVLSDQDNTYATGRLVRIDIAPLEGFDIVSGTIRITSESQGYDSGEQALKFGSIFYEWDTTGLPPAVDYKVEVVEVVAKTADGTIRVEGVIEEPFIIELLPNPPLINKLVSNIDISVPARGIPVRVNRSYLLDSDFNGPLGYGWTHSYRMRIVETPTFEGITGTLTPLDGTAQVFNADGSGSHFMPNFDGTYQSPKGDFRVLTKDADGRYLLRDKYGTKFNFAANGKLFRIEDRNGNGVNLIYDNQDILASILDASGQETSFHYDANNRISSIKDPTGQEVKYQYDAVGNLVSVINVGGFETQYTYDSNHNLTSITDPAGRKTFFTVDSDDRLASVSGINGNNSQSFAYGVPAADQMTITDALGNKTILTYDFNGSVIKSQNPLGQITTFSYDADLNLTATTDANGNTTNFTYDNRGNTTSITDPIGNTTKLTYESSFNQIKDITDGKGHKTTLTYDSKGNLISRTHPDGSEEVLSYDGFGNLISLSDGKTNTTSFAYDSNGNLTAMTYPDSSIETYTYDANGNLSSKTDRKNQTIVYDFDALGRLLKKTFPDASTDNYAYDNSGNMLSASDENGMIKFAYDALGRLTLVTYPGGETVNYVYNKAGNRSQIGYPEGKVLDYNYDSLNRLTNIERGGLAFASYQYDALGRIKRRGLQNGTFTTYSYDKANQLLDLVNSKSTSEIISRFSYTYDDVGNRLSMTTLEGKTQYQYDSLSQLIKVIRPDTSMTEYNFDPSGNRNSVTENGVTTAYDTNDLNQYTDVDSDSYSYDANGNLTSKLESAGVTNYSYDFENRLVQVDTPTETVKYAYNSLGRRIQKITSAGTTNYFHDGLHVIIEKNELNAVQATYVFGIQIDEVLLMNRGDVDYFYSQDGLGSIINLTDGSESVVESFSYDEYGAPSNDSIVGNPYLFTGRNFNSITNLYDFRARFYDPEVGRFINSDPVGLFGGNNLYQYVENNPINFSDPFGLYKFKPMKLVYGLGLMAAGVGTLAVAAEAAPIIVIGSAISGFALFTTGGLEVASFFSGGEENKIRIPVDPIGLYAEVSGKKQYYLGSDLLGIVLSGKTGIFLIDGTLATLTARDAILAYTDAVLENIDTGDGGSDDPIDCIAEPVLCVCSELDQQMCFADPTFVQLSARSDRLQEPNWFDNLFSILSENKELVAEIKIPYQDALVRADIPIFGHAYGNQFKSYRVEYGLGNNPTEWTKVSDSIEPQDQPISRDDLNGSGDITIRGNLTTWDTGLTNYVYLPSHPKNHPINLKGTYTVRLVVTGQDGSEVEDRVTVDVANVIPNAWGGDVNSPDGNLLMTIPEQAIMDSFRLISAQAVDQSPAPLPENKTLIGKIYQVREYNERFTKPAELQISYQNETLVTYTPEQLGLYAYKPDSEQWEYQKSYRQGTGSAIHLKTRRLASHYAILAGDNVTEGSIAANENYQNASNFRKAASKQHYGHYQVNNSFELGVGEWSNRDFEVGARVTRDKEATFDGTYALKISNPRAGGNFAVNVVTSPFDVREHGLVQFDYRVPEDVKTNFLVKVSGRWYEIGFTDDPKVLQDKRVNIHPIGNIEGIVADDQWHTAQFNLREMLLTKTHNALVEEMIMADWDVGGYMKLQFGKNAKDASYYIDNFSISRDINAGLDHGTETLVVDHFNQKKQTNLLGGVTEVFTDGNQGKAKITFVEDGKGGIGHALGFNYDVSQADSFVGYNTDLKNLDLRDYQQLSFAIKDAELDSNLWVGLKDRNGNEQKVKLTNFITAGVNGQWQTVNIPLVAFSNDMDWSAVNSLSLSIQHGSSGEGTVLIDDITFNKNLSGFALASFEDETGLNILGGKHWLFANGVTAINGKYTHNSPNGIYALSYGGNIGEIKGPDGKIDFAYTGWTTDLAGINCMRCDSLTFRIKGTKGGEQPNIYISDGDFKWGVDIEQYVEVSQDWQTVNIPLQAFAEYGVDLSHLAELQFVFEWEAMSGTVYLDDIKFGDSSFSPH